MSILTGLIAADQGKEIALVVPDIPKRKKNDCKKIERNEGRTYPKNYAHIMLYVQKHMNKITRLFVEDEQNAIYFSKKNNYFQTHIKRILF